MPHLASDVAASAEKLALFRRRSATPLTPQSVAIHEPRKPPKDKESSDCHAEPRKTKNHDTATEQKKTRPSEPMARNVAIRQTSSRS